MGEEGDVEDAGEDGPSSRKRRRSKKGVDGKKFDCPTEGCGKSYSRAEHLYRHQLNREFDHASIIPTVPLNPRGRASLC